MAEAVVVVEQLLVVEAAAERRKLFSFTGGDGALDDSFIECPLSRGRFQTEPIAGRRLTS